MIISEHLYQTRSSRVFYPDFRDKNADEKIEVDEDKVDSLDDSRDKNDDGNIDDKLEGFREDFIDNYGDLEEDQEPGKDMKPEPPPQPPLYRPSRPPIKLSFIGTNSFELRISKRCPVRCSPCTGRQISIQKSRSGEN